MNRQKKKNLRIKRETANRILNDIVQRAEAINASPESEYMYYVSKILVFGSYLTPKERLGDIDVAIKIEGRWATDKGYDRLLGKVCRKKVSGDSSVLYPYQKIITTLRNRSKSLSFHPIEEVARGNFPHKIIFERNH
jgi:predicted nucleotidyltransferase